MSWPRKASQLALFGPEAISSNLVWHAPWPERALHVLRFGIWWPSSSGTIEAGRKERNLQHPWQPAWHGMARPAHL